MGFASHDRIKGADPPPLGLLPDLDMPSPLSPGASAILPAGAMIFQNFLNAPVMLFSSLWGPRWDGPAVFLGEAPPLGHRPLDHGKGLPLPPLAHRSRISVRRVVDGMEIWAWRIDAHTN